MCTDGTPLAERAVAFGALLARAAGAQVTLLGVERPGWGIKVRGSLARLRAAVPTAAEEKFRLGRPSDEILAEARSADYDLIVIGSRGRRGLARVLFGSVAPKLARYAPAPVLIVKGTAATGPVRRILACTSGDERGERAARWAGRLAHWLDAEVTVLHVLSQIGLAPDAKIEELTETAEQAMAAGTREGKHLERELSLVREAGATGPLTPKLRNGLVLDEVAAEASEGNYDLVVIGAHEPPGPPDSFAGLRAYLLDDVADQIISAVQKPVLVLRGK
jgi:nucleotide-binding universal stress UspA family protein